MNHYREYDPLEEECFHSEHADSRWLRYCPIEAVDPNGDLGEVVDRLNATLYDIPVSEHDDFSCTREGSKTETRRTYEQEYLPDELTLVDGYRMRTTISHSLFAQPTREAYYVLAEWCAITQDQFSESYWTEYYIERFAKGEVLATITEFDLTAERIGLLDEDTPTDHFLSDRPMTSYDHVQLHRLLGDIEALHLADRAARQE